MRVLLVGSGGREHALAWKLAASPMLTKLWAAPGNPGIGQHAECVPIGATDIPRLVAFARERRIDLVVPGPEAPLVAGLADAVGEAGILCCGPTASAARIEGSKAFAKEICDAAGVPTARWERFDTVDEAQEFIRRRGAPIVVKADGLASGKGVVVAATVEEAEAAAQGLLVPGGALLVEECLQGREASLFALCDGRHAVFLGAARDHKRVGDGDTGPNTGGMGAVSPVPGFHPDHAMDGVIRPVLAELARRGTPFRGVLFAGLMLMQDGVSLIEFNARFGDPECQALMPLLRSDLLPALVAACEGELADFALHWRSEASCAVVIAARGYPGEAMRGGVIQGVEAAEAVPGALVFQAGTREVGGALMAEGGRVLTLVGTAPTPERAREIAYRAVSAVDWPGGFCRTDIGAGDIELG